MVVCLDITKRRCVVVQLVGAEYAETLHHVLGRLYPLSRHQAHDAFQLCSPGARFGVDANNSSQP